MSGLGRRHAPDERDRDYPLARSGMLPAPSALLPPYRYWATPKLPLDQGATPTCVGHAARGLLNAAPVRNEQGPDAFAIYHGAQENDEWPGTDYDGTSARGAMKYLSGLGYISAYVWATTVAEAERWVSLVGPLMLGLDWLDSYDNPGPSGILKRPPDAQVRGGHEVLIVGVHRLHRLFRVMNSWGSGWAQHGRCWLPYDLLDQILADNADLVTPTETLVG